MGQETHVYEPLNEYKHTYKNKHDENVKKYLNDLIEKSGINKEENRTTIKKINQLNSKLNMADKKLSRYKALRITMIILIVITLIASAFSIYKLVTQGYTLPYLLVSIFSLIMFILCIVLMFVKVNPIIKNIQQIISKLEDDIESKIEEGYVQLSSLNRLFDFGIAQKLFQQTLPIITMDRVFDSKRLDYLANKFMLNTEEDINTSTLAIQSGMINGNPFYFARDLVHELGEKVYTGQITISWTTSYVDRNGKTQTRHHSQQLSASISKPYPYYAEQAYLIYGNEAAPKLSFERDFLHVERLSDKECEKHVNKQSKVLAKKERNAVTSNSNYTMVGNNEFEVLFNALDRSNEVEFRLLFSPLAQQQMVKLLRDKEIGYGDNFYMGKDGMINLVTPEHLINFDFQVDPKFYIHYDIDTIINRFVNYNNEYFKNLYFSFAPLLAIPLMQQQKPHEYIYKDVYPSYLSYFEHEAACNKLDPSSLSHPNTATRTIIKTSISKKDKNSDVVNITAYSYKAIDRIEYVTKVGGDNLPHAIPVHWTEYIPVEQPNKVEVQVVQEEKDKSYRDLFEEKIKSLKDGNVSAKDLAIGGYLISKLLK